MIRSFEESMEREKAALLAHPVYERLRDFRAVRRFMEQHVFAVWDFMGLLKSLQRRLTVVESPWRPPARRELARFVNEIVLGEESDEVEPGRCMSHLELYLEAMDEVGADSRPFSGFLEALVGGTPLETALDRPGIGASTRQFVATSLRLAAAPVHVCAAAFCHGREDVIPAMFRKILDATGAEGLPCSAFRLYLDRHCTVDGDHHGPLSHRMLAELCGDDPRRWAEAEAGAQAALRARRGLWDGLVNGPCGQEMLETVTAPDA